MADIQSVVFDKNIWTLGKSKQWLINHELISENPPYEAKTYYRYRITESERYELIKTKDVGSGIKLVIGFK